MPAADRPAAETMALRRRSRAAIGLVCAGMLVAACTRRVPPDQAYCAGVAEVAADIAAARASGASQADVRDRAIALGTTQDEPTAALLASLVDAIYETAVLPEEARQETFLLCVQEGWQLRSAAVRPPE